jgi:iron complex transport system permease protein
MKENRRKRRAALAAVIVALPIILFFVSLNVGSYPIPLRDVGKSLLSLVVPSFRSEVPPAVRDIILLIRLPRLLLAVAAGASLAVSGAALQALFKNPLVNEYILGLSSGSAFGAALSLVFLGRAFPPQAGAFLFAVVAVLAVLLMAGRLEASLVSLLLTGVIVSAFFSALLMLVEFLASPYALQSLFYWLMGNLSLAGWGDLALSLPLMAAGLALLFLLRWRLNVLSMNEEEARAMGVDVRREKWLVILAATLITAAATSVAGIIGWLGLIVPHLVRMAAGVDNRSVIPLSAALGASFLLAADAAARSLTSIEIPIGIFTSLIGIPVFLALLNKSKKVWL